jgi:adenylate cyclase
MSYQIGPYLIDPEAYEIRREGKRVPIEPQVFDLLLILIENRVRAVSKDEIIKRIWNGRIVSDAALSSRIKAARRVLGDSGSVQGLIRTIHGRGFRFVGDVVAVPRPAAAAAGGPQDARVAERSGGQPRSPSRRRNVLRPPTNCPSLVVLPFRHVGDEPRLGYLVEGLVEEVTSGLSRVRTFFVIARASAQKFAHRDVDVRKVARALGVRYVVQGSVRVAGPSIRVSIELIDGPSRQELWSQRFDGQQDEAFALQDRVTEAIIGALEPSILVAEVERVRRKKPENMEAYDCVLRGMPKCWALTKTACLEAMGLLETAIAADQEYGLAHALLSWCHGQQSVYNWTDDPAHHKQRALQLARRAATLDGGDPLVLVLLGTAECVAKDVAAAAVHVRKGLELDPNSAWGWNRSGYIHTYLGEPQIAVEHFQRSLRLSPFDPVRHNTYFGMAGASFVAEDYDQALAWIDKALLDNPEMIWANRMAAACAAMAGDRDRASQSVAVVQSYASRIRAEQLADAVPFQVGAIRDRYRRALVAAGFPP